MTVSLPASPIRAHLLIRKRMQFIQGKTRACCHVQAIVDPTLRGPLEEHFNNEALFKRAAYAVNWPKGAIQIPAALAPAVGALLKNDACPEITVKTMLAGQLYQGTGAADMMSFELIAKLAFDNLKAILETVADLDRDVIYTGWQDANRAAFDADTAAELQALSADISPASVAA
jgi:hypothetical protein